MELGAQYVIAKTNREIHEKFLLRNGADEVVYPEKESANKAALRLSTNNVFEYIELTPEYCICCGEQSRSHALVKKVLV